MERGKGENVGESNGGKGKKEEEGKENKRVENSRIRVRETCLVYFILGGKKYTVYRLFDKIDPLENF